MHRLLGSALAAAFILLPVCASAARRPLAVVEVASCNAFSADIGMLAQAINAPFIAMGVNGWLSLASACPNLAGVDVNKPLRLIVLPAEAAGQPPVTAAVLPLLDRGEIMLAALRGANPASTPDGDVLTFSTPAGAARKDTFVVLVGRQAVTGLNRAAVVEVAASLRADTLPTVAAVSGTLRATLDVATLVPLLENLLQQQAAALRTLKPAAPDQPNPGDMLALQQSALLDFLRQVQSLSIGLAADAGGATLYTRTDPAAASTLSRALALRRPVDPRYRQMLPPTAIFTFVGTGLDAMDLLADPYAAFMERLYAKMGAAYAPMAPLLRKTVSDAKGLYTGGFALAVTPATNGVELVEYIAVTDERAAARMLRDGMTNTMAFLSTGPKTGFGVRVGAPRLSGKVEILPFHYTADAQTLPPPAAPFMKWLGNLYGEGAVSQGHMVMAIGASNTVSHLMDGALARLATTAAPAAPFARVQALFPEISADQVTAEWYLASSDVLRLVLAATGQADARQLAQLPSPGAGIGGIELRQGDALFGALRVSTSELKALSKAFSVLKQSPPGARSGTGGATVPAHMSAPPGP